MIKRPSENGHCGWPAFIKRPIALLDLIKWLGLAADKLLTRGNMKSAIRSPNLTDLAIWPLLIEPLLIKLDKTAIGFDKTATAASGP